MTASRRHAFSLTVTLASVLAQPLGAGPRESTEVIRAQVELSVCDARNAGSDDPVSVTLGGGTVTWLDHPGPDFERAGRYRYDVLLDGVQSLGDITRLEIAKLGSDDLCLAELRLLVNGRTIYIRAFSGGMWLRGNLVTTGADLRASSSWQSYSWSMSEWVARTGAAIPRRELVERLESRVASAIHDAGLHWNGAASPALAVRRKDGTTVVVRAELVSEVPYWLNNELTLDFDLSICGDGQADPSIGHVALHAAKPWYSPVQFRPSASDSERMLMTLRERLSEGRPVVIAGGICPRVDAAANIVY